MLPRPTLFRCMQRALRRSAIVAVLGPRQCGKTTLARMLVSSDAVNYFDLEHPGHLARLEQPLTNVAPLVGTVVIDEVQRRPDLFPVLRVLADRTPTRARYLLLGSASPSLLRQSSESLAGRVAYVAMRGFSLEEAGLKSAQRHWLRGGFPRSFLARTNDESFAWRADFVSTFLERDIPQLGFSLPATTLRRFWIMLAHYHGQIWNAAEVARALGVSAQTVGRYLDLLTDVFMVRQLPPWHANLKKRQVKAPKVYIRDSGLLHYLLGVRTEHDLLTHPKCGASWEGYLIEEILGALAPDSAYFWATHQGAEIDLVVSVGGQMLGVECKRADAPGMTPSLRISMQDLRLQRTAVLYPGDARYMLAPHIEAVPFSALVGGLRGLFPRH